MQRQGISYIDYFLDDIPSCFCDVSEERRTLAPAHLQAVGDHDFNAINRIDKVQQGEDTTKIPGILVTNGHAPESIFDVRLGE